MAAQASQAFAQRVDGYMAQGFRVESQTDTAATLIKGERVNHVLHLILSIVTLGAWLIVWAILTRFGGRTYVTLQVGPAGAIHETRRRDLSGCALHALTAWIVLQIAGAVIAVVFVIVAATAATQGDLTPTSRPASVSPQAERATPSRVSLADEFGCQWIMDTYRPMATLGRDTATLHVSNEMTLKRQQAGNVFGLVGSGDAAAALRECEARGFK